MDERATNRVVAILFPGTPTARDLSFRAAAWRSIEAGTLPDDADTVDAWLRARHVYAIVVGAQDGVKVGALIRMMR